MAQSFAIASDMKLCCVDSPGMRVASCGRAQGFGVAVSAASNSDTIDWCCDRLAA
ncbi:MAG: hypothetical protein ACHQDD_03540 [Steroidobacterales bacterium]